MHGQPRLHWVNICKTGHQYQRMILKQIQKSLLLSNIITNTNNCYNDWYTCTLNWKYSSLSKVQQHLLSILFLEKNYNVTCTLHVHLYIYVHFICSDSVKFIGLYKCTFVSASLAEVKLLVSEMMMMSLSRPWYWSTVLTSTPGLQVKMSRITVTCFLYGAMTPTSFSMTPI